MWILYVWRVELPSADMTYSGVSYWPRSGWWVCTEVGVSTTIALPRIIIINVQPSPLIKSPLCTPHPLFSTHNTISHLRPSYNVFSRYLIHSACRQHPQSATERRRRLPHRVWKTCGAPHNHAEEATTISATTRMGVLAREAVYLPHPEFPRSTDTALETIPMRRPVRKSGRTSWRRLHRSALFRASGRCLTIRPSQRYHWGIVYISSRKMLSRFGKTVIWEERSDDWIANLEDREDRRNANGGAWTFRVPKANSHEFWKEILMMAIGEILQEVVEKGKFHWGSKVGGGLCWYRVRWRHLRSFNQCSI